MPIFVKEDPDSGSCIDRINYWRKVACEEGWANGPSQGLPPMTECTCCDQCSNGQAEYNSLHGSHKAWLNCGERSQGETGGETCAQAIDALMNDVVTLPDGTKSCPEDHCGPVLAHGCRTFLWGVNKAGTFWSFNWGYEGGYAASKCQSFCTGQWNGMLSGTLTGS